MKDQEYTTEQLKQIADLHSKQVNEWKLKIVKIDKKYKANNKEIISSAVLNVTMITMIIGMLLKSDKSLQSLGTDNVNQLLEEVNNYLLSMMAKVDSSDMMATMYLKLYNILEEVINKIGIMGIVLANVALSFVTKTISKGYKSTQLKKEKEKLEEKIKNFKQIIEEPINEANKSR